MLIHHHGDIYKRRYEYKGQQRWKYSVRTYCTYCGNEYFRDAANAKKGGNAFCSIKCKSLYKKQNMEGTIKFKRGAKVGGHQMIYLPDHPNAKKNFYPLHRHIVEKSIGRLLDANEIVHHIDCNQSNNDFNNLHIFATSSEHFKAHGSLNKCVEHLLKQGVIKFDLICQQYSLEVPC